MPPKRSTKPRFHNRPREVSYPQACALVCAKNPSVGPISREHVFSVLTELNLIVRAENWPKRNSGHTAVSAMFGTLELLQPSLLFSSVNKVKTGKVLGKVVLERGVYGANETRHVLVDVGREEPLGIMYGGLRTLMKNQWVVVAPPGARLESGDKVRSRHWNFTDGDRKVRIDSQGMLLSWVEATAVPPVLTTLWEELLRVHTVAVVSGSLLVPGMALDKVAIMRNGALHQPFDTARQVTELLS